MHRACTDLLSALCDRSCCVKIYLFEDDKLRASEDESHDPGDDDHTPATRLCSCRETAHRAADRQIAIETHRCQEERRAGQRHYLYPSHSRNTDSVSQNVPRSLNVMCIETAKLCKHFTACSRPRCTKCTRRVQDCDSRPPVLVRQRPAWVTWPTTVSSSPTPVSDNCVLPTLEHSLSVGRAAVLET